MVNQTHDVQPAKPSRSALVHRSSSNRKMGNQATQRLLGEGVIQAKLTVNQPGDRFEQQADRMADAVMRMPDPSNAESVVTFGFGSIPSVRRICSECEEELHGSPDRVQRSSSTFGPEGNKEPEEELNLQAKGVPGRTPEVTPSVQAQIKKARDGGQPLAESARGFFEPRFGRDFSNVRVHTDAQAAESAQRMRALAYTMGRDIVFGKGNYSPDTQSGRHLLAHELTHVIQQRNGYGSPSVQRLGDLKQRDPGLLCPIPTTSAPFVDTDVFFSIERSDLTPKSISDVASFVARWNAAGANKPVRVDGFASTDGSDRLNWPLSCDRALMVEGELMTPSSGAPGVPASFIEIFAHGETSEFSTALEPNRRATISADLAEPACANPGVSRTLDLQPVFLRTDPTDASPTGASWTRRFNESNAIWGKLGVTFAELTPLTIDTPLKTAGATAAEISSIAALRTGSGVEVLVVDNDMTTAGGATTLGPLAPLCTIGKIVMSDRGTSNTLLAHELGHILGIQHPGVPPNPGEAGTIMVASGSHSVANSTRNTLGNGVLCPPGTGSTCLNPDA